MTDPQPITPTGLQSRAYLNSGTHDSEVWSWLSRLNKVSFELNGEEVSLELVESAWKRILAGQDELVITGTYVKLKNVADANFTALMDSKIAKTPIEIGVLDGAVTDPNAMGMRGYMLVTKMKRNGDLNAAVTYDFESKLTEYYESDELVEPDQFTGTAP